MKVIERSKDQGKLEPLQQYLGGSGIESVIKTEKKGGKKAGYVLLVDSEIYDNAVQALEKMNGPAAAGPAEAQSADAVNDMYDSISVWVVRIAFVLFIIAIVYFTFRG